MRFYLVDRVDKIAAGQYIEGVKCISMSEDVFEHHFPENPIFPGSLIIEGLAQLSGFLLEYTLLEQGERHTRPAISMVNRMKFRKMVIPGDRLTYRGEIKVFHPNEYAAVKVTAEQEGQLYAEGELLFIFIDILDEEMAELSKKFMAKVLENTLKL